VADGRRYVASQVTPYGRRFWSTPDPAAPGIVLRWCPEGHAAVRRFASYTAAEAAMAAAYRAAGYDAIPERVTVGLEIAQVRSRTSRAEQHQARVTRSSAD
jgi:hypothetical protein